MSMGKGSLKTRQHTAKLEAKYSGAFFRTRCILYVHVVHHPLKLEKANIHKSAKTTLFLCLVTLTFDL